MAAGIFFLFILLLIIAAWTDLKEGYIPDSVSILIFLLSFYSLFIRSGPGLLLRIEGAVLCGGLLEGIRLISRGGIGMGDVKLMTACGFHPDLFAVFLFSVHPVRSRTSIAYRGRCSLRRAFGRDPSYQPRRYWYG